MSFLGGAPSSTQELLSVITRITLKACFALHHPSNWESPALINAIGGRKLEEGGIPLPELYRKPDADKMVQRERKSSEFAQLSYLAFLSALRVPSEALQLRRTSLSER